MSKALSVDLRERAVAAAREGATHREAAERFGVSAASVSRWQVLEARRETFAPRRRAATASRPVSTPTGRPSSKLSVRKRIVRSRRRVSC